MYVRVRQIADVVQFVFLLLVFVLAFGVAAQTLMYPNSRPAWTVLYNVVYYPYMTLYQQFIPVATLQGFYDIRVMAYMVVSALRS